ncbi:hypothetical protein AXG93_1027s1130 [Marchantia polymorpha subsp. ruderalis]|uniref:Uncharacterized protein n=1 Tax=Marchantia polymorpha subsp. ruderalis TaxID=1480154 RepID=A0A176W3C0_MARPO|nr:hypothetical protein AXG93_1027s1130 [Marchantia polymorpha subsp. ruderalis]
MDRRSDGLHDSGNFGIKEKQCLSEDTEGCNRLRALPKGFGVKAVCRIPPTNLHTVCQLCLWPVFVIPPPARLRRIEEDRQEEEKKPHLKELIHFQYLIPHHQPRRRLVSPVDDVRTPISNVLQIFPGKPQNAVSTMTYVSSAYTEDVTTTTTTERNGPKAHTDGRPRLVETYSMTRGSTTGAGALPYTLTPGIGPAVRVWFNVVDSVELYPANGVAVS